MNRGIKRREQNTVYSIQGILQNTFCLRGLYFRVNSREHRNAKIKSLPIISNVKNIEEYMKNHENKVSCINLY